MLVPLLGSAASLHAQDKPAQLTEKLTPLQVLKLNEMAALRARMGGGVTEQLEGVVEGVDPEKQFLESLETLVQEQGTPDLDMPPRAPVVRRNDRPAPRRYQFQETNGPSRVREVIRETERAPDIADRRRSTADAAYAQRTLRDSAKKLEQLAAELEQAQFYDKADELRKTATNYWLQARSMD